MKEKSSEGTTFKPLVLPDTGLQPARYYAIIDLGSHLSFFKNQPVINQKTKKQVVTDKICIYWELPKFMNTPDDPQFKPFPATIKQEYSYSCDPKAKLPDVLKSSHPMKSRPEKINEELLKKFVGHPCMLNIEHAEGFDKNKKPRTYANVSGGGRGVNAFMKEFPQPVKYNEQIFFSLDSFSWELFNKLPKYAQDMIRKSLNFPAILAKHPEPIKADAPAEFQDLSGEKDFSNLSTEQISDDMDLPF